VTHLAYEQGIATRVMPSLINHISPLVNVKAVADIRRVLVRGKYDIVHTHSSVAGVVGRLAAFTAGVPVIIHHVHGWGLHENMSSWTRLLYLNLERLCARYTTRLIAVCRPDIQGLAYHIGRADQFTLIYNGIDLEIPAGRRASDAFGIGFDPDCKLVGMTVV
jgi:glycosyltransferase involved in cell wall biosynthesis